MSIKDISLHGTKAEIPKEACTGKVLLMNDRISDLPDDILVQIISPLTLKEAGSTSVLSKRWRHVWAYVPRLNFDASQVLDEIYENGCRNAYGEEPKYFRWVNQVVSSHQADTIDEFRVRYNFRNSRYHNFDHWLRFAMEKKVKRLEFNILALWVDASLLSYTLPSLQPWSQLTSLELACVDVTGLVLQKFLSDCPDLEHISVRYAMSLVDLKVGSLKLKSLKLEHCFEMEHLEISAPNLIYFYYYGSRISSPLKNTPKLTEVYLGGIFGTKLLTDFSDLSSCMSQLEVLTLTEIGLVPYDKYMLKVYPVALRLKMLHIGGMSPRTAEELFDLIYLIKSCPLLHKLELKLRVHRELEMTEEVREVKAFPHPNLKILEMTEFSPCEANLEFAMLLLKTFVSVEKITIVADGRMRPIIESRLRARKEAERLRALIKPGTELEILSPSL